MKNELYFKNVAEIGNLFLEHIFLEFDMEPIFFTCVDNHANLYLCLCSEIRGEQRWVISECKISTLHLLVMKKIDMSSALCFPEHLTIISRDLQGYEKSCVINTCDIDPLDLPKEGTLLKCNVEAAEMYIYAKCKDSMTFLVDTHFRERQLERYFVYLTHLNNIYSTKNFNNYKINLITFHKRNTAEHHKYCIKKGASYLKESTCQNFHNTNNYHYLYAA